MYILTLLSRGPETGYSIMQHIEERTEGAWRPGPGTMYPLLKGLTKEGLARTGTPSKGSGSKTYHLTPKGKREIDEIRQAMAGAGRKEPVMGRLFSDMLPGRAFVPLVIRRYKEGMEIFKQKLGEVPPSERIPMLKELRLLAESQIGWVDSMLAEDNQGSKKHKVSHENL